MTSRCDLKQALNCPEKVSHSHNSIYSLTIWPRNALVGVQFYVILKVPWYVATFAALFLHHPARLTLSSQASLLRQIVAGPRARHPEAGLDLCYVTDNIIATSGPSSSYPQRAYRNPLDSLVKWLDSKHGEDWAIWEFRAEGTGYPDSEVYNRIWHFPWPDHHPPPFVLIPRIMASMRNWLHRLDEPGKGAIDSSEKHMKREKIRDDVREKLGKERKEGERVVVVHCKAGKGRSGSMACSYLIAEEDWKAEDAMKRFTERRMRPGFGNGISIPSQLRWIDYVTQWTNTGKMYVERQIEICEVHVWGLRDGVKICVEGYVEEGKTIKVFHVFKREERELIRGSIMKEGFANLVNEAMGRDKSVKRTGTIALSIHENAKNGSASETTNKEKAVPLKTASEDSTESEIQPAGADVVYRPSSRVVLQSNDINIDFERRNKTISNLTMVTSVAHVWFNTFFEGHGAEQGRNGQPDNSGVFEIEWEAMDGIKGSSRKGTKSFDRLAVVWKALEGREAKAEVIKEPAAGEEVKQSAAADWRGGNDDDPDKKKELGLRVGTEASTDVSRANSPNRQEQSKEEVTEDMDELAGVQSHVPEDDKHHPNDLAAHTEGQIPHVASEPMPQGEAQSSSQEAPEILSDEERVQSPSSDPESGLIVHPSTADLPGGKPEDEMKTAREHRVGHISHHKASY